MIFTVKMDGSLLATCPHAIMFLWVVFFSLYLYYKILCVEKSNENLKIYLHFHAQRIFDLEQEKKKPDIVED